MPFLGDDGLRGKLIEYPAHKNAAAKNQMFIR
jgi:hypothetical protein